MEGDDEEEERDDATLEAPPAPPSTPPPPPPLLMSKNNACSLARLVHPLPKNASWGANQCTGSVFTEMPRQGHGVNPLTVSNGHAARALRSAMLSIFVSSVAAEAAAAAAVALVAAAAVG